MAFSARLGVVAIVLCAAGHPATCQVTQQPTSEARRISVTWTEAPIRDVLRAFSLFSGKSIVAGPAVTGAVTADINDQPWDVAMQTLLAAQGLVATENEAGIIRVDDIESLNAREAVEPLLTRTYRISHTPVAEIQATLAPLLTTRGNISSSPSTNTIVVSDIARVHRTIERLLGHS